MGLPIYPDQLTPESTTLGLIGSPVAVPWPGRVREGHDLLHRNGPTWHLVGQGALRQHLIQGVLGTASGHRSVSSSGRYWTIRVPCPSPAKSHVFKWCLTPRGSKNKAGPRPAKVHKLRSKHQHAGPEHSSFFQMMVAPLATQILKLHDDTVYSHGVLKSNLNKSPIPIQYLYKVCQCECSIFLGFQTGPGSPKPWSHPVFPHLPTQHHTGFGGARRSVGAGPRARQSLAIGLHTQTIYTLTLVTWV